MLALLLTLLPARAADWPLWQLPAPLPAAGNRDLIYPHWFAGDWQVSSHDPEGTDADLRYPVRFVSQGPDQTIVGDRAFNAAAVGQALLGPALLEVGNDPSNPNRQLGRLQGEVLLESTVVKRRSETTGDGFWSDELALQVVHQSGSAPRVSQVETLSRYQLQGDGSINGEQWQATYPSPAAGLQARPLRSGHWQLRLIPDDPGADPTS